MKTTRYFTLILLAFVILAFVPNTFAQGTDYTVRVIYFHPNDIEPQEDSVNTLRTIIKDVQTFYANEMERHGYGRKTFRLETDANDDVILHHMKGNFDHTRYNDKSMSRNEIRDRLDFEKKIIYLIWVDRYDSSERAGDVGGSGSGVSERGSAWVYPTNFDSGVRYRDAWETIAHEIGHAFGLKHDFRNPAYIMSYGPGDRNELSSCTAKWLETHKYFNDTVTPINNNTSVQMLPPSLSEPLAIRLRFDISDADGLHQLIFDARGDDGLVECKKLSGYSSSVEFVTNAFDSGNTSKYSLLIIDRYGNFIDHRVEIRPTDLLPPSEVVSIPDTNLAAAIREALELAPDNPITQLDMLKLRRIYWKDPGHQITNLAGLENAVNLQSLGLHHNQIEDITPLSKLTKLDNLRLTDSQIKDITPLSMLTKLNELWLSGNQIEDIKPLSKLANSNLRELRLSANQISDVSPLAGLTNLRSLRIDGNQISDITPLAGLVNLRSLRLWENPIKNRKPLLELLQKNPDIRIYLKWGGEPLPVTLSHFRAGLTDTGVTLKWITESEVDNAGFYIYRSETKDGEFKVINPTMIQGAGTTSERNEYTWTDTTAKPNVAYYYRIEDISHAGVREQLATVRMRGLVSASGKLTTRWADLKRQE